MKKIAIILSAILLVWSLFSLAQENKKMTKKEREAAWRAERLKKRAAEKAREAREDSIEFVQAVQALQSGSWALEASSVTFNNGYTQYVTPSINYISINEGTGVVQTAFDNTNAYSPNGLGGVTLEGRITDSEITRDSDGNIYYNYVIQGSNISATIQVALTANTNNATAYISPNFSGRNIYMEGEIYPYSTAGVFEGTPDY